MIRYPNGAHPAPKDESKKEKKEKRVIFNAGNRGMDFEADINQSNIFYAENHIALITKRPTPINIVKVDYSHGARITDAYFESKSTTDYNGVYRGKYLDFEAKSCHAKTSFPLHNITEHQIQHLEGVLEHGGIAFFLLDLVIFDEVYLLDANFVIKQYRTGTRKSIPYSLIQQYGAKVKQGFLPRLQYLETVDEVYFHEKNF